MVHEGGRVDTDVVVVGGGTAGNVVAARLAATGREVVLLEAGPDPGALVAGRWPADLLDASTLATSHDWGYSGPAADGRTLSFERARVIGGCSSHNGSTMSIGWRGDDGEFPAGWSTDDLAPAHERAMATTRVSRPDEDSVQPFQRAFLDACADLGVARTDDLLDPDGGVGTTLSSVNVVDGVRWNTALAYLDPVRHLGNLRIVDRCLVDSVEIVGGRAVAVHATVDGRPLRVGATTVVLCAGAYGTPAILLRSGVGPADHLRPLGIDVVAHLPGVGSTLQDHPVLRLEWAATPRLVELLAEYADAHGFLPEEQCVAKVASAGVSIDGAPFDTHVFPWIEPDPEHTWRCVVPIGLLRPTSTGTVRLADRDPATAPVIDHRYLADPHDVDRLLDLVPWTTELASTCAMAPLLGTPLLVTPGDDRRTLAAWARANHHHYWHPTGGAALGHEGDPTAVCDARAAVMGIDGLHVADASLFPRAPRATPALPVTAIGEHVAAILARTSPSDRHASGATR